MPPPPLLQQETKRSFYRRSFSPEEDAQLVQLVSDGLRDWRVIAQRVKARNARQCRERYNNYLSPEAREANSRLWTEGECLSLIRLYEQLGPRWSQIAQLLSGRMPIDVRNKFRAINTSSRRRGITHAEDISARWNPLRTSGSESDVTDAQRNDSHPQGNPGNPQESAVCFSGPYEDS
ncbi:MAG: hypothetical protein LBD66_03135 [Holosporales bacterium]|nr:hypothetical protein [Holosporales bacterium]